MKRRNNQYNFRNRPGFPSPCVKGVYHRTKNATYLAPKIRDIVSEDIKKKSSLNSFKESVEMWVRINCPSRICKVYLRSCFYQYHLK